MGKGMSTKFTAVKILICSTLFVAIYQFCNNIAQTSSLGQSKNRQVEIVYECGTVSEVSDYTVNVSSGQNHIFRIPYVAANDYDTASMKITLKNDTDIPYVIEEVFKSCGCLNVDVKDKVLDAGKKCQLEVVANLQDRIDRQTVHMDVRISHANEVKNIRIGVSFTPLVKTILLTPALNLGELKGGKVNSQSILRCCAERAEDLPEKIVCFSDVNKFKVASSVDGAVHRIGAFWAINYIINIQSDVGFESSSLCGVIQVKAQYRNTAERIARLMLSWRNPIWGRLDSSRIYVDADLKNNSLLSKNIKLTLVKQLVNPIITVNCDQAGVSAICKQEADNIWQIEVRADLKHLTRFYGELSITAKGEHHPLLIPYAFNAK